MNEEISFPVITELVYGIHENCGGKLKATDGPLLMTDPPRFPHQCDKCDNTIQIIGKKYPMQRYTQIMQPKK